MRLKLYIPLLIPFLFACQDDNQSLQKIHGETKTETVQENEPGLLYIKLSPQGETRLQGMESGSVLMADFTAPGSIVQHLGATKMERLFPPAGRFEARTRAAGLHRWYIVHFNKNIPVTRAGNDFTRLPEIEYAEPVQKLVPLGGKAVPVSAPMAASPKAQMPFNDPQLTAQWHYYNEGTLPLSEIGADINLFPAWEITKGSRNVIVAVVDGGIDTRHEDLKDNLWVNEAEKNGTMGVDDDGNGYVDDIYGFNYVDNNGTIVAHEHGTHVAGTVSAVNNNGIGVCGVAGGSGNHDGVLLMSCQIYKPNPNDPDNDYGTGLTPQAIKYGADNGAVISQNSWGYTSSEMPQATKEAIDYFIQFAGVDENGNQTGPMKGGIVIFAAGNSNTSVRTYPAAYSEVLSVAAMAPDFKRSYYSNFGSWVKITAPGGSADYDLNTGEEVHQILSTLPDNQYGYMQGTSMACPHVSGIAALVISKYGGAGFTPEMLKERLLNATKDIDAYNPGYKDKLGKGYIDASMALGSDEGIAPDPVTDLHVDYYPTRALFSWTITRDEDNGTPMRYDIAYSTQPLPEQPDYDNLPQGVQVEAVNIGKAQAGESFSYTLKGLQENTTYYFHLTGVDPYGNRSEPAVETGKTKANLLPALTCRESGEITLTRYAIRTVLYDVADPEGGQCSIALSDPNGATEAAIEGNVVTVTIKAANGATGNHQAEITVTDEDGGTVRTKLAYTVYENRTPVVVATPETVRLNATGATTSLELLDYFNDPDNDALTYSVVYSKSGIVTGEPVGNTLQLTAQQTGETEVVITARDPYGQKAVITFKIVVGGSNGDQSGDQKPVDIKLYPNPVISYLNVSLNTEATGKADVSIYTSGGARVYETTIDVRPNSPARLDLSKLSGGSYLVKIGFNGTTNTRNIIKL